MDDPHPSSAPTLAGDGGSSGEPQPPPPNPPTVGDSTDETREIQGEHPGAALLGPYSGPRLREASLVLRSMSIQHIVEPARLGSYLVVLERDRKRAATSLRRYEEENRGWPPPKTRERLTYGGLPLSACAFALLAVFAWVTGPAKFESTWFTHGTSVSSLVMSGHAERAVTALTLHADGAHVLGNVLSGAIFAHMVERRLGPGIGLLSIVTAGAAGNFANAAYYFSRGDEHLSIGASTAVMGAIGVLAATQFLVTRTDTNKRSIYDWATPIVGGLTLLGTLGSSATSDIGAHGFGFLGGLLMGALLFLAFGKKRAKPVWQAVLGAAALAVLVGSWQLAFLRG